MCGIVGYSGEGNELVLQKMRDTLTHRGPDASGSFVAPGVGLAHRRLSIIDLSAGGAQPMSNETGDIQIVFNGEIYNYKALKEGLKHTHTWKGTSDTEIIVHLYEEIGTEAFSKLEGMFAIALYDGGKNKLILARDRMGKKPLYWTLQKGTLLFASEIKAMMAHPLFRKEIDLVSLDQYLLFEYVPTPRSIFKGVSKVRPGHTVVFQNQKLIEEKEFWDITFQNKKPESFEKSLRKLDTKIEQAVSVRLMSDVPLGVFLSGGIDSSTIAYYAQKQSRSPIQTFSIGFQEKSFDESDFARQVAQHLGTNHHEILITAKDSLHAIPRILGSLDEPFADPSILPTALLSQFTKKKVTVVLGGDGGDELFFGYDTFLAHRLGKYYELIPVFLRETVLEKIVTLLPTSHSNLSFDFKLKKFILGFSGKKEYRDERWLGAFGEAQKNFLYTNRVKESLRGVNSFAPIDQYIKKNQKLSLWQQLSFVYERMYLMDQVMVKVDRASMLFGLEARSPLLDTSVVDFANNLPTSFKVKGLTYKYILKKLMEGRLPRAIIYRKKKGFGVPVSEWLMKDLDPLTERYFSKSFVTKQGLFQYGYIQALLLEHKAKKKDHRKLLWTLLAFQVWYETWYK